MEVTRSLTKDIAVVKLEKALVCAVVFKKSGQCKVLVQSIISVEMVFISLYFVERENFVNSDPQVNRA